MQIDQNRLLAATYAEGGIPVLPAQAYGPRVKQPLVRRGFRAATTDVSQIDEWWYRFPGALVGTPTGPQSGIWILDVDGEAGRLSLDHLLAQLGLQTPADLTPIISRTPSGGLHLFFRLRPGDRPRTRAADIAPGLDTRGVKADGSAAGYFIAPGSLLPSGQRYELIDPASLTAEG